MLAGRPCLIEKQHAIAQQHSFTLPRFVLRDKGREGLGELSGSKLTSPTTVLHLASDVSQGTVAAFPHIATLHCNKRRDLHRRPVPYGYPYPGPVCRPEACDKRHSTRGRTPMSLQRGCGVHGRRRVYMKHDPPHGTSSLKELVGVAVPQTVVSSVGRDTRVGISPPPWKSR